MSNIRKRLATRVEPTRVVVPYTDRAEDGKFVHGEYVLIGMPDDYTLSIKMMGEQDAAKRAALWNAHLAERWPDKPEGMPAPFTNDDVYGVLLVLHYLQEKEDPPSEVDMAMFSKEHGPDYIKLFAESVKIANNKTGERLGDEVIEDPVMTVGKASSSPKKAS